MPKTRRKLQSLLSALYSTHVLGISRMPSSPTAGVFSNTAFNACSLYLIISLVEKVQKRFNGIACRRIYYVQHQHNQTVGLGIFNLQSLEYHRISFDRILYVGIVFTFSDIPLSEIF